MRIGLPVMWNSSLTDVARIANLSGCCYSMISSFFWMLKPNRISLAGPNT